ncbi:MAG: holo-ACP synthase [candidate division WOR-3 bacterium]
MIGTDIVKVDKIKKIINHWGDKFINRIFTLEEKKYCENKSDKFQCYAGRFAVKESFYKAKNHPYGWKAIEIINQKKPILKILNEKLKKDLKDFRIHFSLSHTDEVAIAVVLLEKQKIR